MTFTKCTFAFVLDMDARWRCPPHHHFCTEIVFCVDCSGTFLHRRQRVEYGDGDVIVCQSGESHWVENAQSGRQMCFGMNGAGAETIPVGVYRANDDLLRLRDQMAASFGDTSPTGHAKMDLLCGLVATAIQDSLTGTADAGSKTDLVREIIDTRYTEEWDTATLAYEVGLSPDYLRQVFRSRHGTSVARYLREVRLKTALRLLEATEEPVRQIAKISGFGDPSYFSMVFRNEVGQSPAQYRETRCHDPDPALRLDNAVVDVAGSDVEGQPKAVSDLQSFLVNGDPGTSVRVRGVGPDADGKAGE